MRYIEKIPIELLHKNSNLKPLLDYINQKTGRSNPSKKEEHPEYGDIKDDLRKKLIIQLRQETYGLCCFCQKRVLGEMIEHFLPQGGEHHKLYPNEKVDYYNLFFCCITKDRCSSAKGDSLVAKFITHPNCESFFQYSDLPDTVEILPRCSYKSWQDCENNLHLLDTTAQMAFVTIKILNLNVSTLSLHRKKALQDADLTNNLLKHFKDINWLKQEQAKYLPTPAKKVLPEFANMFLYFINEQIEKRFGRNNI